MPARAADRVFISYRRDDAAGYAGRLEASLEARLGAGSVFRDLLDIAPGADFDRTIVERLVAARSVLVLIGPRWAGAGADGTRRIDDPQDFVHREVAAALAGAAQVVPVLLPGATMPGDDLPPALRGLTRRQAFALGDVHWDADVARLVAGLGGPRRRRAAPWAAAAAAVVALAGWFAVAAWRERPPPASMAARATPPAISAAASAATPDPAARLVGVWHAEVRYAWGDRHRERYEFTRHAGALVGSAGFLGVAREAEQLTFDGHSLHFQTRTRQTMGGHERQVTHAYSAELRGTPPSDVLAFRMVSRDGFDLPQPITFEARRDDPPAAPRRPP